MGCLGVHFSLSEAEVKTLRGFPSDAARLEHLQEELEEKYFANDRERIAQSDKAWDAIHRALSDGTLDWDGGEYPLNCLILGGESLYDGSDYIMSLKSPGVVADVTAALSTVTESAMSVRYFDLDPLDYGFEPSAEDFEYTWHWFETVRTFWLRAASEGRYVLFTADQ